MKIDHRASLLEDSAISMSIPFIPRLREERREGLGGDTFASGPNRAGDLHHVVSVTPLQQGQETLVEERSKP